jgi:hypothetical protein
MRSEQMNAPWVKSSFSFANGNCVEVADLPGSWIGIRDSQDPGGPVLRFTRAEWAAFLSRAGRPSGWSRRPDQGVGHRQHTQDDGGRHLSSSA